MPRLPLMLQSQSSCSNVTAADRLGDDVIDFEVLQVRTAASAVAALLAVQCLGVRLVGRQLAEVGALRYVRPHNRTELRE